MVSSRSFILAVLACLFLVEAKVASPSLGLQRRKHHHHHHRSGFGSQTPDNAATTAPPDASATTTTQPANSGGGGKSEGQDQPDYSGPTLPPPKGGFPPETSRAGGFHVDDVCFGFSTDSITKGLIELNRLRLKFTHDHDNIPRPTVYWNSDLALEAYKVAKGCQWQHGDTPGLGQNLNSAGSERNLTDGVVMWWSEEKEFVESKGKEGGHLGASAWNQVTAMGCAIVDCSKTSAGYWITACNMNNDDWKDVYPPQPIPQCPKPGTVVPYHKRD